MKAIKGLIFCFSRKILISFDRSPLQSFVPATGMQTNCYLQLADDAPFVLRIPTKHVT